MKKKIVLVISSAVCATSLGLLGGLWLVMPDWLVCVVSVVFFLSLVLAGLIIVSLE